MENGQSVENVYLLDTLKRERERVYVVKKEKCGLVGHAPKGDRG